MQRTIYMTMDRQNHMEIESNNESTSTLSNLWLNDVCQPRYKHDRKISDISHTLVGNKIVDHWDVVGASSPVGAAPTTSSFSTWHLASGDLAKTAASQYESLLSVGIWCVLC